jgi:predicted amidophosphoribosyltransferase
MDERLEKALEFSNFLETQNNQKRIFLKQYKDNLIHYTYGHKFTASTQLINLLSVLIETDQEQIVILDDNETPVTIDNPKEFMRDVVGVYIFASRKYAKDYDDIKKNRSVEGLINI